MLKVLELFGGIGACTKALKRLGINYKVVDYVEIDKYAVKSYNAINDTTFEPQDICKWEKNIDVDLIMHGSPCQDFSLAGKQAGGDKGSGTRSSLMYETIRIVEKLKPKYVIWENVKNILSKKHRHNFDAYLENMEQLGYTNYYQVLNAKDYGIPQNRERVFTISIKKDIVNKFTFPEKKELKVKLKDLLEEKVDEKYYLSEKMIKYITKNGEVKPKENFNVIDSYNKKLTDNDISGCIVAGQGRNQGSMLMIKNATKKGFQEAYEGDGVNISSRMKYQRGNVQKESIQTLTTSGGNERGVVVNKTLCLNSKGGRNGVEGLQPSLKDRIYDSNGIATCCATSNFFMPNYTDGLRIRKLTSCETWLLMGFDKSDYEKASKVNSNAQLYKQAGNSIVVNVLEVIFKELFKDTKYYDFK